MKPSTDADVGAASCSFVMVAAARAFRTGVGARHSFPVAARMRPRYVGGTRLHRPQEVLHSLSEMLRLCQERQQLAGGVEVLVVVLYGHADQVSLQLRDLHSFERCECLF